MDSINGIMKMLLIKLLIGFVIQAYLNTVENGGETEFLYQNKRINAVQGTVLFGQQDTLTFIVVIHL